HRPVPLRAPPPDGMPARVLVGAAGDAGYPGVALGRADGVHCGGRHFRGAGPSAPLSSALRRLPPPRSSVGPVAAPRRGGRLRRHRRGGATVTPTAPLPSPPSA